jgi:hypothetical protein
MVADQGRALTILRPYFERSNGATMMAGFHSKFSISIQAETG